MNEKNRHKFEIIAGVIGNALVWYNFALFMPFLPIISKEFFPMIEDPVIRTNVSLLAVAVGLLVRPLGSAIFGPIGDKIGRQKAISMSILLMAVPTFLMGFIPTYEKIGIWAPILLIVCRALQGISLGGEYTAAMVNFVEKAPGNRRGFYGSWSEIGSQIGVLLAAQALVCLHFFFSETQVYEYGWRFAFFGAIMLLPFAFLVHEEEKPKKEKHSKEPIFSMLLNHKKEVISTFFITAFSALGFYTLLTFLPYYLVDKSVLTIREASMCSVLANFSLIISAFICGYLSDIFKRKGFLAVGMVGVTIVVYFMFLMDIKSYTQWLVIQILYGWFIGMYYSCRAAFFSEAFPKSVRCTGVSVSLSFAQAIFGGTASNIMNFCVSTSKLVAIIPATIIAAIALYCLTLIEDRTGKELCE